MNLDLNGKTAFVTGSSQGIGLAIARAMHSQGCRVVLNGREQAELTVAVTSLPGSFAIAGDMTDPAEAVRVVSEVLGQLGHLDILVCNVGSGQSVPPGDETASEWQRVFAVNLWSTTNTIEAARSALAASRGVIICISSICGLETIPGAPVTYSVAKAALNAYVKGISRPLGKLGVRINAVAPGNVLFDGSVWSRKMAENPAAVQSMLEKEVALSRLGTPEDIANLVIYLASSISAFATGSVWTLDGGQVRT